MNRSCSRYPRFTLILAALAIALASMSGDAFLAVNKAKPNVKTVPA